MTLKSYRAVNVVTGLLGGRFYSSTSADTESTPSLKYGYSAVIERIVQACSTWRTRRRTAGQRLGEPCFSLSTTRRRVSRRTRRFVAKGNGPRAPCCGSSHLPGPERSPPLVV